jgi:hypothetical protein
MVNMELVIYNCIVFQTSRAHLHHGITQWQHLFDYSFKLSRLQAYVRAITPKQERARQRSVGRMISET